MSEIMDEWKDLKPILQELETLFQKEDDIQDILEVKKLEEEYGNLVNMKLSDTKELIKTLTALIAKKEADIIAPSQTEHTQKLKNLMEKENCSKQMEELSKAIEVKKLQIDKLQTLNNSLQESAQEYSLNNCIADSRTAYAISLYSKISNISWDYKASNLEEGKLVGYVGNESKKELKKFELNTKEMSEFSITNKLWSIIEESA